MPRARHRKVVVGSYSVIGAIATTLLWGYCSAIYLLWEPWLPFQFGPTIWFTTFVIIGVLAYLILSVILKSYWISVKGIQAFSYLIIVIVISVITLDNTYSIYLNISYSNPEPGEAREMEGQIQIGELYPRLYYPTEKNFRVHKPNVTVVGTHFGLFYSPSMLRSPTLVRSVLERNKVTISINAYGFRESNVFDETRIAALGDSFTFGWGVDEDSSWLGKLETLIAEPIYNLGIHDASPKQEAALLEYVLRSYNKSSQLRHLLWMIYEGNDLEDSYDDFRPSAIRARAGGRTRGTLVGLVRSIPAILKKQAVITKFRMKQVTQTQPSISPERNPYIVDDVPLGYPLYHSPALGFRLFSYRLIERAQKSQSYVYDHPNRTRLDEVFLDVAMLAKEYDFEVTVLLAPTATRLHGPYFEDFPLITQNPYFIDYVADLSQSMGFETVDLYELMKRYGNSELLYFRDDDHLNKRGHEVVAELIHEKIFGPKK